MFLPAFTCAVVHNSYDNLFRVILSDYQMSRVQFFFLTNGKIHSVVLLLAKILKVLLYLNPKRWMQKKLQYLAKRGPRSSIGGIQEDQVAWKWRHLISYNREFLKELLNMLFGVCFLKAGWVLKFFSFTLFTFPLPLDLNDRISK